jgi:glycosyltransferase involved in cell wall biosynthesis
MKVLLCAQAPAHLNPGGSEVAAENLALQLAKQGHEIHLATAVPAHFSSRLTVSLDHQYGITRYFVPSEAKHPDFRNRSRESWRYWDSALNLANPEIIHFHSFLNIGTNIVSRFCSSAPVVFTLHEYLAMCLMDGQLLRTSGALCSGPSEIQCLRCNNSSFNDLGSLIIEARSTVFRETLRKIETVIAPSEFLTKRFLEWGMSESHLKYIPNVLIPPAVHTRFKVSGPSRVLYLSSLSRVKGLEVLIKAAERLAQSGVTSDELTIEIWGRTQPHFGERELSLASELTKGLIVFRGSYDRSQIDEVLSGATAVVCPSIWYENRPTVVDEAVARGVPVLVSNIGGMVELATESNGTMFRSGDDQDLAQAIQSLIQSPRTTKQSLASRDALRSHADLYLELINQAPTKALR